jgi:hypothetical protein
VLVTAAVTLLPLPAESGRTTCADRTHGLALRSRGPVGAQKGLASSSYDRAEIRLGGHALLARTLYGGLQDPIEGTGDVPQRRGRYVRVGLGGMNVRMAEQHLNDARARTLLDQVRGIAVA